MSAVAAPEFRSPAPVGLAPPGPARADRESALLRQRGMAEQVDVAVLARLLAEEERPTRPPRAGNPFKRFHGAIDLGPRDVADRHDAYLAAGESPPM